MKCLMFRAQLLLRFSIVGILVLLGFAGSAGLALAAPPAGLVDPMDCLREWDDNLDYMGDGWPQARVFSGNGVTLKCGDVSTGVVHISDPDSTGKGHPIEAGTEAAFLECLSLTVHFGKSRPDKQYPETRTRISYAFSSLNSSHGAATATAIVENDGYLVRTFYTSTGSRGNDWVSCAASTEMA